MLLLLLLLLLLDGWLVVGGDYVDVDVVAAAVVVGRLVGCWW